MRRSARILVVSCLPILTLVACGGGSDQPADSSVPISTTTEGIQIANPASQYCIDQGGTLEIVDEAGGQVGYCTLPDGTRVEEWEFFNSQTAETTLP